MKAGGSLWGQNATAKEDRRDDLQEVSSTMAATYHDIFSEIGKVVAGQHEAIEQILISIFTKNHALLEGYPGLGKTLMVNTLSQVMDLKFKRVQCTPDLMPSDITGTYLVEETEGKKRFRFDRAGFHEPASGRRDKQGDAKDAVCAPGSDAGKTGDCGNMHVPPGKAVLRSGYAKPHRDGGNIPIA